MTDTPWNFVRGNQWIQTNLLFSCHHLPSPFYVIKTLTEASLPHASGALSVLLEGAGREVSSGRQNDQSRKAEGKIPQILVWNDSAAFSKNHFSRTTWWFGALGGDGAFVRSLCVVLCLIRFYWEFTDQGSVDLRVKATAALKAPELWGRNGFGEIDSGRMRLRQEALHALTLVWNVTHILLHLCWIAPRGVSLLPKDIVSLFSKGTSWNGIYCMNYWNSKWRRWGWIIISA